MKLKKYMLISMVAVTLASCGDDFLEEKMVATITQDYFDKGGETMRVKVRSV